MKLTRFRVQNFRSFTDSGWIECDSVTAIAGVNEAGKSNLLRALWKLNPGFKSDNKILKNDIPIDRFDEILDGEHMPIFITAEFRLRPLDREQITQKFGPKYNVENVRVSRYLSGEYFVEYPFVVPENIKPKLDDFIIKIMPGFVYYSNYGNLDSNIYLPQMLARFNKNGVNAISKSKQRTIKLLLLYIGITPEMLVCDSEIMSEASSKSVKLTAEKLQKLTETNERYKKLFKAAGARLTREFNQWWRQGEYTFEFAFDAGNLTIFVTDKNGLRAPLDDRSVGIQWFLSFFLVFSLESQVFLTNTVMLLDESGATLHGLAQQDLVNFFDELAKSNQIIYSTHSSFMLPAEHLNRTRVVYKDKTGHSLVSSDMTFKDKTISAESAIVPVTTAVNTQITARMLHKNEPIVVMDEAVERYLITFRDYLLEIGELPLEQQKRPLLIIPGEPAAVEGLVGVLAKQGALPNVIVEESRETYRVADNLKTKYGKHKAKLVVLKDLFRVGSVEDLIPIGLLVAGASRYLESVFGPVRFNANIAFLEQIESLSKQVQVPSDFRLKLAEAFSLYVETSIKDREIRAASATWLRLFEYIYKF